MTTTPETKLFHSFHGKIAKTQYKNIKGTDWEISTMKRSDGKISCIAQAGSLADDGSFCFEMFGSKRLNLVEEKRTATEKALIEIHNKGLALFDQMKEEGKLGEEKKYQIEEGQILFLNGYGQDEYSHDKLAVYKIENGRFGKRYHTVNLSTLALTSHDHIKNINEKFGIGIYYKEDDKINVEELNNYVIDAFEKQKAENRKKESEQILNDQLREAKIEEGKKLVNVPLNAKSIIVGILKQNESDSQTDYFGCSTEKTVYLAYSSHKRDLFDEMRKASLNCDETKFLFDAPEEYEHREKYSMGSGYYLGGHRYSGWEVRKISVDLTHQRVLDDLYIAAAEGRFFCNVEIVEEQQPEVKEVVTGNGLELVKYSEKALAIFGNTKEVKETLKSLKCKFNPFLTHPITGLKQAGWICQLSNEAEIKKAFKIS